MSEANTKTQAEATAKPEPVTFHEAATDAGMRMAHWVLDNLAEVKTVFVGFDYGDALNDSGVAAFVWQCRDGAVRQPEQVVCSLRQLARLHGHMLNRLRELTEQYAKQLAQIASKLREMEDEQEQKQGGA